MNTQDKQIPHLSIAEAVEVLSEIVGMDPAHVSSVLSDEMRNSSRNKKLSYPATQKVDEGKLGRWLLALSQIALERKKEACLAEKEQAQTKRVYVDLEGVKKDLEYELFFLKKEDGTRFFNARLLRNMKLVSDFGIPVESDIEDHPLTDIQEWTESYYHEAAKGLLKGLGSVKEEFFYDAYKYKDNDLVYALGKSIIALMMCSHRRQSQAIEIAKNYAGYFADFQLFLREALHSREYERLLTYPPRSSNKVGLNLLNLTHALCKGLYVIEDGQRAASHFLQKILDAAQASLPPQRSPVCRLSSSLSGDWAMLNRLFKGHVNMPLVKILQALEEGGYCGFDPLSQQTLQLKLFSLEYDAQKALNMRMGCPTVQEYINKASVNDEFKGFLRACSEDSTPRNILLINLQDKTSWKERARCTALEELQKHAAFSQSLAVVTIGRETDFYHQAAPYNLDNQAEAFLSHFKEQFGRENSGYYFPEALQGVLGAPFCEGVTEAIHRVFYSGKNMLLRNHRLDFIEIFNVLLTLKMIEIAQPDSFSLICKDGLDSSAAFNALLYSFLKTVNRAEGLSSQECQQLSLILHAPAMMVRGRLIQRDKFSRFVTALKAIENAKEELGAEKFIALFHEAFAPFFSTSILTARLTDS